MNNTSPPTAGAAATIVFGLVFAFVGAVLFLSVISSRVRARIPPTSLRLLAPGPKSLRRVNGVIFFCVGVGLVIFGVVGAL